MKKLSLNIKYLRTIHKLTQVKLAEKLKIKRSLLGAIEEGRTEPRASTLSNLSNFFKISIDQLVNDSLNEENPDSLNINKKLDETGKTH